MQPPPKDTVVLTCHIPPHIVPNCLAASPVVLVSEAENAPPCGGDLTPSLTEEEGTALVLALAAMLEQMTVQTATRDHLQSALTKLQIERGFSHALRERKTITGSPLYS